MKELPIILAENIRWRNPWLLAKQANKYRIKLIAAKELPGVCCAHGGEEEAEEELL